MLLGMKNRKVKKPVIIELLGPIDVGKKYIAQLVARRINGTFISFPKIFSPDDFQNGVSPHLIKLLTSSPKQLERNPEWWAHLYIASIYEYKQTIEKAVLEGPVILTNYINSYRIWMKSIGLENFNQSFSGFTKNLPKPNIIYYVNGEAWKQPNTNLNINLSPEVVFKINSSLKFTCNTGARKVDLDWFDSKFTHAAINKTSKLITNDLKKNFKLDVNELVLYTSENFLPKKYE
jgi:hypothetical protein